jgi:hypothetical protein
MGEFGATGLVEEYLPFLRGVSRYVLWKLFYRPIAQQILSLANFCKFYVTSNKYQGTIHSNIKSSKNNQSFYLCIMSTVPLHHPRIEPTS